MGRKVLWKVTVYQYQFSGNADLVFTFGRSARPDFNTLAKAAVRAAIQLRAGRSLYYHHDDHVGWRVKSIERCGIMEG